MSHHIGDIGIRTEAEATLELIAHWYRVSEPDARRILWRIPEWRALGCNALRYEAGLAWRDMVDGISENALDTTGPNR